jgi:hypothetical protein
MALSAIARFSETFAEADFRAGYYVEGKKNPDGSFTLGYYTFSDVVNEFLDAAQTFALAGFDWVEWKSSDHGRRLLTESNVVAQATEEDLRKILTAYLRQERFCGGTLWNGFERGIMQAVTERAAELQDHRARQ